MRGDRVVVRVEHCVVRPHDLLVRGQLPFGVRLSQPVAAQLEVDGGRLEVVHEDGDLNRADGGCELALEVPGGQVQ
jgi:hypothetical protein